MFKLIQVDLTLLYSFYSATMLFNNRMEYNFAALDLSFAYFYLVVNRAYICKRAYKN